MTFVPASAAALRRAAFLAARSVLSRRAGRPDTSRECPCRVEPLECRMLFNAYFVTIGPNPSGGPDDSGSLHIKPEYDSDGDGVTDNPVTARTGEDAIWQVVEGSWCHTVHHCGTATTYTYTFPDDASTTQDRAFWLDVSDDPNTHAAHGAIGLQADWADPNRDTSVLPDWNDAVWSIDASPVVLNTLTATNNAYSSQAVTASDTSEVSLSVDPGRTDTADIATLTLTGTVTPDKQSAYSAVLYKLADPNGATVQTGTLSPSGSTIQADWTNFSPDSAFLITAGVDQNGDGVLDGSEVTRSIRLRAVKVTLSYSKAGEPGTSAAKPKEFVNGTTIYESVVCKDGSGDFVAENLDCEVVNAAGTVVTTFSAHPDVQGTSEGTYKITVDAKAGAVAGAYTVNVFPKNDRTNILKVYIKY